MITLQRRQHIPYNHNTNLPSPPSSQHLSFDELSQQLSTLSAQEFINQKLLNDYLESQQQQSLAAPVIVDNDIQTDPNQFMTGAFDFSNPAIRIQQSTPVPQLPSGYSHPSMNNATASGLNNWSSFSNNGQLDGQTLQTPAQNRTQAAHQRAASSSSIGSNASQYQSVGPTTGYPYVAHSENSPSSPAVKLDSSYGADEASRAFSNHHLPTPTHTPTQDSFLNPNFNNYASTTQGMDSTMAAHFSMKQALMEGGGEEDVPGFGHSARHSVSSYGQDSPATPHTTQDDYDERFKVPPTGEMIPSKVETWFEEYLAYDNIPDLRHNVPKLERTYTDVALDELYNPNVMPQVPQSAAQSNATSGASLLSPYRSKSNDVQRALQMAQNARSQSPSSSASRGVSPFRQNSPYRAPSNSFNSPRMRVGTAAQQREAQKAEDDAYAMKHNMSQNEEAQPKTISPKDALLDYRETDDESKVPLFPENGASEYEHQYSGGDQYRNATQSNFDTTSAQSYRRDNSWATPQFQNFPTTTSGPSPPQSNFNFVPPSISGNLHGLPFASQHFRTPSSNMPSASEPTPEFPAHLTSMESSASEAGPETGSTPTEHIQKPAASNADTGTYTCTYHGCTLRFETPQKLQKHKREGHRNANAANLGSSMTSAALLERNSQAGPHKCERINPTTGKPCNTVFSRPYDLTRHEDTIHNARKQKVRCALCVEEKTFSRNDALTRHMRVVHPEVDFPGKHRRRGGNHD